MTDKGRILIVDPDRSLLDRMRFLLEEDGHAVRVLERADTVLSEIRKAGVDLLLADLAAPPHGGIQLLKEVKRERPDVLVVLMTREATTESALEALRTGAHDYLIKPVSSDEILLVVERAVRRRRMGETRKRTGEQLQKERERNVQLLSELKGETAVDTVIGQGPAMRLVRDLLDQVTQTDSTVLITGESGTGKGVLARYIHYHSDRAEKPFIEANCAIYSEGVLQSELFGHEMGAFTGAVKQKRGRFELAQEGTIFLDEIGDLSPGTQLMLLRVLQERKFERVGGEETIDVDVRVIAATNRDLQSRMRDEKFRADLYYRLNVIPIPIPPLRDRQEDIPLLGASILRSCAAKLSRKVEGFTQEAMDALVNYSWPGNIREMENLIERTLILAKNPVIRAVDLPAPLRADSGSGGGGETWPTLTQHERYYIEKVLKKCAGNKRLSASVLGINRSSLYSKMKRLGIPGTVRRVVPDFPFPPPGGGSENPDEERRPCKA
ncbi:MAG: sigma-54 dependent transcriptional regulator [Acidobacteria bacterium]|nr:sigma-54 dependent transcriptional regulator [Acidobacteriota bacterium]